MSILSRHRSTASLAIACLALFVALGGIGYAAVTINGKTIQNKTIGGKKLINKTLTGGKVKSNTLGGAQINESKLGKVPSAATSDSATSAQNATNAQNSQNAQNAAQAGNAAALGGTPADGYLKSDTRGVAVAGAVVDDSGSITSWFNRAGGAPVAKANGGGDYDVVFPGVDVKNSAIVASTTVVGIFGMATADYSGGELHVRTFTGNLAADTFEADDRTFTVTLHPSSNAG